VAWLKSNGGRTTMDTTYFFCNVVDRVRTREDDYRWGKEDACELLMSASDIFRQLSDDEWTEVKATLKERYKGK